LHEATPFIAFKIAAMTSEAREPEKNVYPGFAVALAAFANFVEQYFEVPLGTFELAHFGEYVPDEELCFQSNFRIMSIARPRTAQQTIEIALIAREDGFESLYRPQGPFVFAFGKQAL